MYHLDWEVGKLAASHGYHDEAGVNWAKRFDWEEAVIIFMDNEPHVQATEVNYSVIHF